MVLDVLWKSCWASVQQPVSKLSCAEVIDRVRDFRQLAYSGELMERPAGDALRALVMLLERLLELRYVLKAMKQKRVRGVPRRQAKKALNRQVNRVERVLTKLEWPPELAPTPKRTQ